MLFSIQGLGHEFFSFTSNIIYAIMLNITILMRRRPVARPIDIIVVALKYFSSHISIFIMAIFARRL